MSLRGLGLTPLTVRFGPIRGPKRFAVGDLGHGFAGCADGSAADGSVSKRQHGDEFHLVWYTQQVLDGVSLPCYGKQPKWPLACEISPNTDT